MTSYCVQLLAAKGRDHGDQLLGSFFTHERGLEDTERLALARSAETPGVGAYRILDMGGGVQALKTLADNS